MTHTPEPWYNKEGMIASESDATGQTIAHYKEEVNAARIVACVNGCAGLNPSAYRACVEALKDVISAFEEEPITGHARLDDMINKAKRALAWAEQESVRSVSLSDCK